MFTKSIQKIVLCSIFSFSSVTVFAVDTTINTQEKPKVSKSISYQTNSNMSEETKKKMFNEAPSDTTNVSLQNALSSKTVTAARHESFDYSLFDATTDLISDIDYDGFYHRFAVTIDVDTVFDSATVYADFYLSYEGGPWIYYASTDNYDINSDSAADKFTIETELADGYPTGYYDMRIKVYDADSDEYLLTYDYIDDSSLSAIPLEDSYRDDEYSEPTIDTEVIVTYGAGSMNLFGLFILCVLLATRQFKNIFCIKESSKVMK